MKRINVRTGCPYDVIIERGSLKKCADYISEVVSSRKTVIITDDTVAKLVSGFGGGVGRMREICGTISGMTFVLSYLYGYSDPKAFEEKAEHYARVQQLANKFKEDNGSVVCRELLSLQKKGNDSPVPEKRTKQYYKKRPCPELARYVADILEDYINDNPPQNIKL